MMHRGGGWWLMSGWRRRLRGKRERRTSSLQLRSTFGGAGMREREILLFPYPVSKILGNVLNYLSLSLAPTC